ncbi:7202_t:CDS:2 [Funneliformis caledonium]|uniref:7202_t:CDS:1 n=1 Tax=Funneliformis caledonium TaxID=1117310 RepID=A0A9N9D6W4_9GLOM|nr:7202_t:CDS:2 [Funneliformis caledonium]
MEYISTSRALYITDESSLLIKKSKYLNKLQNFAASSRQELQAVLELIRVISATTVHPLA